jgi:hypothetical protein
MSPLLPFRQIMPMVHEKRSLLDKVACGPNIIELFDTDEHESSSLFRKKRSEKEMAA